MNQIRHILQQVWEGLIERLLSIRNLWHPAAATTTDQDTRRLPQMMFQHPQHAAYQPQPSDDSNRDTNPSASQAGDRSDRLASSQSQREAYLSGAAHQARSESAPQDRSDHDTPLIHESDEEPAAERHPETEHRYSAEHEAVGNSLFEEEEEGEIEDSEPDFYAAMGIAPEESFEIAEAVASLELNGMAGENSDPSPLMLAEETEKSVPPQAEIRDEVWTSSSEEETITDEAEAVVDDLADFRSPMEGGRAKIRVIGVGGAGTNSVTSMLKLGLADVEFLVVNTDVQALQASPCPLKLQIGAELTRGLGAGSNPDIGRQAAEMSRPRIEAFLRDADMVFVACGMGGGTGTGAAPVIAQIARELGVLSVGVCTKPFRFEGPRRQEHAEKGLAELARHADTMIVVSNQKLLESVGSNVPIQDAFEIANNVLAQGVGAISELVSVPGLINVDFADIRAILSGSGDAVMGIGRAKGEQRATAAVHKACSSPLLEKLVVEGAKGILICIHGGSDLTLHEVNEAASIVNQAASPDANIIFGAVVDERLHDELKATVLATGFSPRPVEKPVEKGGRKSSPDPLEGLDLFDEPSLDPFEEEARLVNSRQKGGEYSSSEEGEESESAREGGNGKHGHFPSLRERLAMNGYEELDEHDIPAYKRMRRGGRFKGRFFG